MQCRPGLGLIAASDFEFVRSHSFLRKISTMYSPGTAITCFDKTVCDAFIHLFSDNIFTSNDFEGRHLDTELFSSLDSIRSKKRAT